MKWIQFRVLTCFSKWGDSNLWKTNDLSKKQQKKTNKNAVLHSIVPLMAGPPARLWQREELVGTRPLDPRIVPALVSRAPARLFSVDILSDRWSAKEATIGCCGIWVFQEAVRVDGHLEACKKNEKVHFYFEGREPYLIGANLLQYHTIC